LIELAQGLKFRKWRIARVLDYRLFLREMGGLPDPDPEPTQESDPLSAESDG
jgi:hypothetical protein